MAHDNHPAGKANGRRTAIVVILVAFLASATTAVLAFVFSHRAQQSDAAAIAADTADLRAMVADWDEHVALAAQAAPDTKGPYVDMLTSRTQALIVWKPRTPCGDTARDDLRKATDARMSRLLGAESGRLPASGNDRIDEGATVEASLRRCAAEPVSTTAVKAD
ncbi:MAG: hypothetical protein ABW193_01205 [Luteibacter sp.]